MTRRSGAGGRPLRDLRRRSSRRLVGLDELEEGPEGAAPGPSQAEVLEDRLDAGRRLQWLAALVDQLKPLDRQLMLLYLEGLDAAAIGEVTGLSPANVAGDCSRPGPIRSWWRTGRR